MSAIILKRNLAQVQPLYFPIIYKKIILKQNYIYFFVLFQKMAAEKGEEAAPANEREEMEKRIQHRRERIKERLEINIFYYIYLLKIILNIFVCYQKFMSRKRLAKLRNMRLHQLKRKS